MKKILFAASEGVPFIKTGGLADVVGSLPKCIDKKYFDVRVIIPKYACMKQEMKDKMRYVTHFYMDYNWKNVYVGILEAEEEGVHYYFIDNESYFNGSKPYSDDPRWEIERYAFFSKAVLSVLPVIGFRPDVIHCHDWQTGLIPVYLKERFREGDFFRGIKSVITIHNLKFQGKWDTKTVQGITGLPDYYFIDNESYFSGPKAYTDDPRWEIERYAFFSKAVLSALPVIGFRPELIHCHDWQTGLIPVYLKERFREGDFFRGIKSVITIHNLKFQGKWDTKTVQNITGLPS